jgi:hypothetical protein
MRCEKKLLYEFMTSSVFVDRTRQNHDSLNDCPNDISNDHRYAKQRTDYRDREQYSKQKQSHMGYAQSRIAKIKAV